MKVTGRRIFFLSTIIALSLIAVSCTPAPEQPKMGTPLFHWNAAKQTFSAADYNQANDNLGEVIKTDNEYTARAMPWRLVLLSGMAKGYAELAGNWESGARANRADPAPFRTQGNQCRRTAGQLALQFAETFQKFKAANKNQKVTLAFPYPTGSAAEIGPLKRVSSGILVPEGEIESLQKRAIERAVLLSACLAVGAPDDLAKTQQIFKSDTIQVEWEVFALALANSFYDQSQIFTRDKLDRPEHLELFTKEALELLKDVPDSKEIKALKARIEKTLKKKR
jgi:hypothetical protein